MTLMTLMSRVLLKHGKKNRQKSTATVSVVVCCCCCCARGRAGSSKLRPLVVETTDAFNPERHPTPPRSNTDRDLPQRVSSCSSAFCPRGSEQSAEGGFTKALPQLPQTLTFKASAHNFINTVFFFSSTVPLRFFLPFACLFLRREKLIFQRASCAKLRLASCDVLFAFAGEAEVEKQIAASRAQKKKIETVKSNNCVAADKKTPPGLGWFFFALAPSHL